MHLWIYYCKIIICYLSSFFFLSFFLAAYVRITNIKINIEGKIRFIFQWLLSSQQLGSYMLLGQACSIASQGVASLARVNSLHPRGLAAGQVDRLTKKAAGLTIKLPVITMYNWAAWHHSIILCLFISWETHFLM